MSSSSTSFNRNNVYYQSLPTASSSKQASAAAATSSGSSQKSVNFKSVSSETKNNNTDSKFQSSINTEEFAKLDALLEDLLAEVDQPILLNSDSQPSNSAAATKRPQQRNNHYYTHHHTLPCNDTTTTNSMDWLNEQKEILRARKEASAAQQPYRKIKSKLDYYITSSTVGCNEPVDTNGNDIPIINNKPPVSPSTRQLYSPTTTTTMTNVTQIPIHQQQQQSQPSNNNTNNNPNLTNSFRSLSTNPALLKNINETDDENIIDSEFDRYSQKSYKSIASTIQRTKYHVVSNDYIESTRPTAATPVPMYNPPHSRNNNFYQSKRALSAPPTEIGKVMLQRMELKSPLTVRQTSVVPFEHPQNAITMGVNQNGEQVVLESTNGAAATSGSAVQQRTFIDNPYNNRGVLRPNNYTSLQPQQQQPLLALPQPQQAVPVTRNVYLNRSYSEVPRAAGVYTNGYETDSGLVTQPALAYSTYRQTPQPQIVYAQQQQPIQNGYVEGGEFEQQQQQSMRSAPYRVVGNVGSYRTIGAPQQQRYQLINDQSGYDTDTGLIKLRHVLDSTRRAPSRNMNINGSNVVPVVHQNSSQQTPAPTPTPVGYFSYQPLPNGRCYTPQFNTGHLYNSQQPPMRLNQYTSSQSNIPGSSGMSFIDTQSTQNGFPMDEFTAAAATPINPSLIQPITDFQYIDANGNIVKGVPAFVSPDGRQIILKDIDPISGIGEAIITPPPQSFIVQHQVAPSSVSANSTLQRNASTSNAAATTVNGNSNGIRVTTSSTNLATHQPQTQQQQQQQQQTINNKLAASVESTSNVVNREETRRSSAASLTGDSSDVIRAYPKFVKATQHYWYKAKISRDEAISLLRDKPPGTFLIRDSNNFPGAYGLALKVDKPPPNVQIKPGADPQNELVRHFLIEPTTKGVRIKGCCNEPIFGSLAALVYQHSLTPLALPIKLILQNQDLTASSTATNLTNGAVNGNHDESASSSRTNTLNKQSTTNTQQTSQQSANTPVDGRQLLDKGAACNVYYLNTVNIESRNGLEGISFALNNTKAFTSKDSTQLLLIQFKVTAQGITISDINKKKFIRQHFPTNSVIYCAVDEKHNWPNRLEKIAKPRIFGVICKPQINKGSNDCHLFVELDPEQPAIAIVDFINRYLIPSKMNLKNVIS